MLFSICLIGSSSSFFCVVCPFCSLKWSVKSLNLQLRRLLFSNGSDQLQFICLISSCRLKMFQIFEGQAQLCVSGLSPSPAYILFSDWSFLRCTFPCFELFFNVASDRKDVAREYSLLCSCTCVSHWCCVGWSDRGLVLLAHIKLPFQGCCWSWKFYTFR